MKRGGREGRNFMYNQPALNGFCEGLNKFNLKKEVSKVTKKKIIPFVLGIILILSISTGYAFNNSAPNFKCNTCHQGKVSVKMAKIEGLPVSYIPGKTYRLTLILRSRLKSFGEVAGGFAIKASAGELIDIDKKNTQISDGFLTHTKEGSTLRKWTFGWKAPSTKTDVTIKVMGIAANGDFSPAGDMVGLAKFRMVPIK